MDGVSVGVGVVVGAYRIGKGGASTQEMKRAATHVRARARAHARCSMLTGRAGAGAVVVADDDGGGGNAAKQTWGHIVDSSDAG